MATILPTPVTPTPLTLTQKIDIQIKQAAAAQLRAYRSIPFLLYGPDNKPFTEEQVTANITAWATNTTTGLSYGDLRNMARLSKASINAFQAGTIVDDVTEATISFGE